MAFDVRQFLTNLSDPNLRDALNAQRDKQKEEAKEFDADVGYLDAAGLVPKDVARTKDKSVVRQMVEADKVKRKIGEETLQQEVYRQQIEAQRRRAAQDAAMANAVDYMRQQQQAGAGVTTTAPADMGAAALNPGNFDQSGKPMGTQTVTTPGRSTRDLLLEGIMRNKEAIGAPGVLDFVARESDPLKARRLAVEEGQLKVNEGQLELQKTKAKEPPPKQFSSEPDRAQKRELWANGFYVTPNDKGGWDVKNRADKQNAAEVLALALSGGDLSKGAKDKNPFDDPGGVPATETPSEADIKFLRANPGKRAAFEKRFGAGSAAKYLK